MSLIYTLISKINLLLYKNFGIFTDIPSGNSKKAKKVPTSNVMPNTSGLAAQSLANQDLLNLASSIYKITRTLRLVDSQITFDSQKHSNLLLKLDLTSTPSQYIQLVLFLSIAPRYNVTNYSPPKSILSLEKNYLLSPNLKDFTKTYSHEITLKSILATPIRIQKLFTNNLLQDYLMASQSR
jgi:hypothetical protein